MNCFEVEYINVFVVSVHRTDTLLNINVCVLCVSPQVMCSQVSHCLLTCLSIVLRGSGEMCYEIANFVHIQMQQ